jgi:hypothetical protein
VIQFWKQSRKHVQHEYKRLPHGRVDWTPSPAGKWLGGKNGGFVEAWEYVVFSLLLLGGLAVYIMPLLVPMIVVMDAERIWTPLKVLICVGWFAIYFGLTMYIVDSNYEACVWFHGEEDKPYCAKM